MVDVSRVTMVMISARVLASLLTSGPGPPSSLCRGLAVKSDHGHEAVGFGVWCCAALLSNLQKKRCPV